MIFIFAIQFILLRTSFTLTTSEPPITVTEGNRSLTGYACEGSNLTISCKEHEIIHIEYANYGRLAENVCNPDGETGWRTDCTTHNSWLIVHNLCSGKSNCTVPADSDVFNDPCLSTPKYLGLVHRCYQACSAHCAAGCNVAGAGKCDRCDFGFGMMSSGSCALTEGNRSLTAYACEESELTISCKENEIIHIDNANYGRLAVNICNPDGVADWRTDCITHNSTLIVHNLCSGKSNCTIRAHNDVFSDPCLANPKYLAVIHQCNPVTEGNRSLTGYACEENLLKITCNENEIIHIEYANYGRLAINICNSEGATGWRTDCITNNTTLIVRNLCSGKSKCVIPANDGFFNDPCVATPKYLGVVHRCYTVCSAHCAVGCNVTGYGKCDHCDLGFGMTSNDSCSACSGFCSRGCNTTGAGKCDQCDQGYELIFDGSCERGLTGYACEGLEITITCNENEIIHIEYANYGRLATNVCNPDSAKGWRTDCITHNSTLIVSNICEGKRLCRIEASNDVFDGPCTEPHHYLDVDYSCRPRRPVGIESDKFCDAELDEEHSIRWNRTSAGREIYGPCPGNITGLCSRKCLLYRGSPNAVWSKINCNGCFDKEFRNLLRRVNDLDDTALKNETLVAEMVSQLSVLTNKSEGLSAGNLNASLMMINRLATLRNNNNTRKPSEKEIKSFVQAASNVLQLNNKEEWKELEAINKSVAAIILFSAEVYGRSLSTLSRSNYSIELADNLFLEAWSLEKWDRPLQMEFPSRSIWGETRGDKISVSMAALECSVSSETQSTLNIWGSYYRTVDLFLPENKDTEVVNSRVLSFSFGGLKTRGKLQQPVLITLRHNQAERMSFRRTCAFWNFQRDDWDSDGCSVTSTNLTHTICSCDHLTNFAILMSTTPSYDKTLSIVSMIGCSISLVSLVLTVLAYAFTWKQSKSAQAAVLLNLCVALIIAYAIFMAGADKVDSEDGCKVVAVLLHYFFLAAFFTMLAEGVELLFYIIFIFHVRRTIETTILIASAWVLPLIIVSVSLGSTKVEGYGNGFACWLSVDSGLIWAFVGPVLLVITANFVILIIVLSWMSRKRSFLATNAKKRDEIRATLWNLSVTCPVLGLGWIFGVFSIVFSSIVFQYLFVIANSMQGLLIFIFHALFHNKKMSEKLSYFYSNYVCRCRKSKLSGSTQMTSTQEPASKVKPYTGIESEGNLYRTRTQLTSIKDANTWESTH